MDMNVVRDLSQGATSMASRGPGRANPVGAGGEAKSAHVSVDTVDVIGMESINQAFKQLKAQGAFEIPEQMGRAIRMLAKEFLDQLPAVDAAVR